MTFVSVVIPCKNDANFLERCLAAMAEQTRPADEIIVVNSCSVDNTIEVAEAGGARVVTKPLNGILAATAVGFDEARGTIIARLDADSVPPVDWIERIERTLTRGDSPSGVTGPGDFYGTNRLMAGVARVVYLGGYFWSMSLLLGHPPLFGSNFAIHADVWDRIRERVHRDVERIHDDLDISYQFEPDMSVVYDPTLRVGISARPFESWRSVGKRLGWAYLTFVAMFPDEPPMRRLRLRRRWRKQQRNARNLVEVAD